jgi:hypothetical protein
MVTVTVAWQSSLFHKMARSKAANRRAGGGLGVAGGELGGEQCGAGGGEDAGAEELGGDGVERGLGSLDGAGGRLVVGVAAAGVIVPGFLGGLQVARSMIGSWTGSGVHSHWSAGAWSSSLVRSATVYFQLNGLAVWL